jgi:UDP-N-acetylmuramyl pentapeptide synthase
LTAGIDAGDVRITGLETDAAGSRFMLHLPGAAPVAVRLPVPGRHMAGNAALAAAAGYHLGMSSAEIAAGLESAVLTRGRLQVRRAGGLTIVDDSYNANADSMLAALETVAGFDCKGRRIAVLGRMAELGGHARQDHLAVGHAVQRTGMDELCVVGATDARIIAEGFLAAGGAPAAVRSFDDCASCALHLRHTAGPDDLILVKGSRSAEMEKVVQLLIA